MSRIREQLAEKKSRLSKPKNQPKEHPAELSKYQDGSFLIVDIEDIKPDPSQPRKHFDPDALQELSDSIKQKGVIQPVIIRMESDGIYLIAGERRYRAAKMAGQKNIPAIIKNDERPGEISLIENIQREDLKPLEEAEAIKQMMEEYGHTQDKVALVIGKSKSRVSQILSLNKLPEEIKEECRKTSLYSRRLLCEIASQKNDDDMLQLWKQAKQDNLKSDHVREIKKRPERNRRRRAVILLDKVRGFSNSIKKLNMDGFESQERIHIIKELESLKNLISDKIQ